MFLKGQADSPMMVIGVAIFLIIAINAVIPIVFENINTAQTGNTTVTNETFTLTSVTQAHTFGTSESGVTSVTFVANRTVVIPSANYTFNNTHLQFAVSPNANATDVAYNVTYIYEPLNYVGNETNSTLIGLIKLFIILGVIIILLRMFGMI